MKVAVALVVVFAACASAGLLAPSPLLVRTPSLDSAVIKSDRLGGNFAYSSVEGHSYAAIAPVVQQVVAPVGVSYTAHHIPLSYPLHVPAVVPHPGLIAAPAPILPLAPAVIPAPAVITADAPAAPAAEPAADEPAAPAAESEDSVAVEAA